MFTICQSCCAMVCVGQNMTEDMVYCGDDDSNVIYFNNKVSQYCYNHARWNYSMRREMQEILPGVWLGPYASALRRNEPQLTEIGITHIITIRGEKEAYFIRQHFVDRIKYLTIEVADIPTQNIIQYFNKIIDFIDDCLSRKGKVLVHGISGISRSASFVIAYVMFKKKCSFEDAHKLVQQKRLCVHPNEGFKKQLIDYEPILVAKSSESSSNNKKRKRSLADEYDDENNEEFE